MGDAQFWAELPSKLAAHSKRQQQKVNRLVNAIERDIVERYGLSDWQEHRRKLQERLGAIDTEAE